MSTGVEHMGGHRTAQCRLERECQRHERSFLATQRTRAVLDGFVIRKDVPASREHVRAVLLAHMRIVGYWHVNAAGMRVERAGFIGLEARLQYALLGVLVSECDAVEKHGAVRLENIEMLYNAVWIHLSWGN